MSRVLVVEDDPAMSVALRDGFEFEKHTVDMASDGEEGYRLASRGDHDVVILDVMLPRKSGLDVCRELRKSGVNTPVIMLTARGQEIDKIVGLKLGADDYVTKPFSFMELLARVEAVLRAASRQTLNARRRRRVRRRSTRLQDVPGDERHAAARPHAARVPDPPLLHRPRKRGRDARGAPQSCVGLRQLSVLEDRRHAYRQAAAEDRGDAGGTEPPDYGSSGRV
jgi:DNA-binding response OmpR family regulator